MVSIVSLFLKQKILFGDVSGAIRGGGIKQTLYFPRNNKTKQLARTSWLCTLVGMIEALEVTTRGKKISEMYLENSGLFTDQQPFKLSQLWRNQHSYFAVNQFAENCIGTAKILPCMLEQEDTVY